jgi:hypothetical protein
VPTVKEVSMRHDPTREKRTKPEVRGEEAPGKHVIHVETGLDKLSVSQARRALERYGRQGNFEYGVCAGEALQLLRDLSNAINGLSRSTALLRMTVEASDTTDKARAKIEFMLEESKFRESIIRP